MSSMVLLGFKLFHFEVIPWMIQLETFFPSKILLGLKHFKWWVYLLISRNFSKSRL